MRTLIIFIAVLFPSVLCAQAPPPEKHHWERTFSEREKDARAFLDSAQRANDPAETAEAWYRLAKLEKTKMNIPEANHMLLRAIRILEKRGPSYELGRCYCWLALNAIELKDKKSVITHIEKALSIYQACDSDRGKMTAYGFLSNLYDDTVPQLFDKALFEADLKKCLYYTRLSYHYAQKVGDEKAQQNFRTFLPYLIHKIEGNDIPHRMEMNLELMTPEKHLDNYIMFSLDYSRHLGRQGKPDSAWVTLKDIRKLIDHYVPNSKRHLSEYEKALADYHINVKDYREALIHLEKHHDYQVQALVEDREGAVSELLISYQTEKKEAQLKLREQDLKNSRQMLGGAAVCLLLLLALSTFLFRLYRKNRIISEHNTLLLQEQNHRVKNNLQVVASLLNLQANMIEDPATRQAIEETQLRISAMVHLHRQLYENGQVAHIDMDRFIADLAESILDSFDMHNTSLKTETAGIFLETNTAVQLGLLINELITNACKYAFPNHPAPELQIRLTRLQGNAMQLCVKDNGLTEPDLQTGKSFGSRLIGMMATQLEGASAYSYHNGLEFILTFEP